MGDINLTRSDLLRSSPELPKDKEPNLASRTWGDWASDHKVELAIGITAVAAVGAVGAFRLLRGRSGQLAEGLVISSEPLQAKAATAALAVRPGQLNAQAALLAIRDAQANAAQRAVSGFEANPQIPRPRPFAKPVAQAAPEIGSSTPVVFNYQGGEGTADMIAQEYFGGVTAHSPRTPWKDLYVPSHIPHGTRPLLDEIVSDTVRATRDETFSRQMPGLSQSEMPALSFFKHVE